MQLKSLRTLNSVKCGKEERTFLTDDKFDLRIEDNLVHIKQLATDAIVITPMSNVGWFVPKDIKEENAVELAVIQATYDKETKVEHKTKKAPGRKKPKNPK